MKIFLHSSAEILLHLGSKIVTCSGTWCIAIQQTANNKTQYTAIFTPWKLRGLGIMESLQGKPALSMEKACKNHKETLCMLWLNPVIFTDCGETL